MRAGLGLGLWAALCASGCGEDDPPLCDASAIASALFEARSGDTIRLGACTIEGAFVVPAGVGLVGSGVQATRVVGPVAGIAVDLVPDEGDGATTVRDLTVESPGIVGIRADGGGHLVVERVRVVASAGVALGVVEATRVELTDVELVGPITARNADDELFWAVAPTTDLPEGDDCDGEPVCDEGDLQEAECPGCGQVQQVCSSCGRWVTVTAAYGLALEAVATATLTNVDVSGFASFAVVFRDRGAQGATVAGDIRWTGGSVHENLFVGLYAGGDVRLVLEDVSLEETFENILNPSYAAVIADHADLSTTRLAIVDNDRYGLLQHGATARHTDLEATGNGDAALWVGDSDELDIQGGAVSGNEFVGILLVSSSHVHLADLSVTGTRSRTFVLDLWSRVEIGDGIQLTDTTDDVSLERIVLTDNERVGLLVDFGDLDVSPLTLNDVEVSSQAGGYGAIAGSADEASRDLAVGGPPGWDANITRDPVATANDLAAAGALGYMGLGSPTEPPIPGIVTPCD